MSKKFNVIFVLILFLCLPSLSLKAETPSGLTDEREIEDVVQKVYPSVVKVEAVNSFKKVATGVVIDKNGYIVTTALITPRDEKISVTTHEGKKIEADFLGMDSETHLALIQAKDKSLTPIGLGKAKDLTAGSWIAVVSISPENTPAFTQGYVNSVASEKLRLNVWVVRGASGSPVIDRDGRMVGLIRGVYTDESPVLIEFRERQVAGSGVVLSRAEAPASGMAQAIPVDIVVSVTSEIREKGKVERGWLGVGIRPNEEGLVEITRVEEDSPAEMARLKEGDIILEVEGKKVTSPEMFVSEIRKRKPRQTITLKVKTDEKESDMKVRLGEYTEKDMMKELEFKFPRLFFTPEKPDQLKLKDFPEFKVRPWGLEKSKYIGVSLDELNRELSEYFGVKEGRGLLIAKLKEDGPAGKAGLRVGDVVVKADGVRIESVIELSQIIQNKKKGDKIKIEFLRDKKMRSVEVEVEEEERGGILEFKFSAEDWKEYFYDWGDYTDILRRQYYESKDQYLQDAKKQMETLQKKIEEQTKKSEEATKELFRRLKVYKGIRA